ncbi:MAG: M28 family peptidase [Gemmatimonadota bacterium]|nr:M28 family peptidase [Gemmatimonadota bacterium]MDH4349651.1 M28 family peptidase [Gemmatimonadota bacterium]MDH5195837.1 M28 family peptidase [Gemmatimonadota bacterium]
MRSRAWGAAALLAACAAGGSGTPFDGEAALGYVRTQVAFGPRIPNTDGHRRAGDWIQAQLERSADLVEVQAFTHVTAAGDTLQLRNFIGRFRPDVTERVLLLAHWDTRPRADQSPNLGDQQRPVPGANDGASGVAVLLGVADVLAGTPPSVGVDLLFVDGEDYGRFSGVDGGIGPDVLLGSRHFAATLADGRVPMYAVLFDMVGDADLRIYQEGYSVSGAPEVVTRVWGAARDLGYEDVFQPTVRYTITDDHIPLLDRGIRAIDVIDYDYPPWHTVEDTPDKVTARSLKIVGDVAVALVR